MQAVYDMEAAIVKRNLNRNESQAAYNSIEEDGSGGNSKAYSSSNMSSGGQIVRKD